MDLTPKLKIDKLLSIFNEELVNIEKQKLLEASIDGKIDIADNEFKAVFTPSLGAEIFLFNDKQDDDDNDLVKKLNYDNIIDNQSVLQYNLIGSLAAKANFEANYFALGFEVDQNLAFSYFSPHPKNSHLKDSLVEDIKDFKTILSLKKLKELKDKAAVSLTIDGKIAADAEVSFSDVLTASLKKISSLLKLADAIQIEVDAGIKLGVGIEIEDDFEIIIQKREDKYWVSINKSVIRKWNGKLGANVGVKLKDSEKVQEVFEKLIDNIEEGLSKELDDLLELPADKIKIEQLETIKSVASAFGIDIPELPNGNAIDKLKELIKEKKDSIKKSIKKILTSNIELGVGFTYHNTKNTESLFSALFNYEALKDQHRDILRLKTQDLLKIAASDKRITSVSFEKLTEIDIKRSLKIGFYVGDWGVGIQQDKPVSIDKHEIFKNDKHLIKITDYEIGKARIGSFGKASITSSISFSASMEDYAEKDSLIACNQFDYELALSWRWVQNNKTRSYELKDVLDFALCWGIITPNDFDSKYVELEDDIVKSKKKKICFEAHIKTPKPLFDTLIDDIVDLSSDDIAQILAESTPYADVRGRMSLRERKTFYKDFWSLYLGKNPSTISLKKVKELLSDKFTNMQLFDLAAYEADEDGYSYFDKYAISNLIDTNFIGERFIRFQDSMKVLNKRFDRNYKKVFENKAFRRNLISIDLKYIFNLRVLGRMMLFLAKKNQILSEIERTFKIEIPGQDDIIISIK